MSRFSRNLAVKREAGSMMIARVLVAAVAMISLSAQSAFAADGFRITAFDGQVAADAAGAPFTQAAGHPYSASTAFDVNSTEVLPGLRGPVEPVKDVTVDLPPGLVGNPTILPKCDEASLQVLACPNDAQMGVASVNVTNNGVPGGIRHQTVPLYNMIPPLGVPAAFAFNVGKLTVPHLYARLRPDADYSLAIDSKNISQLQPLLSVEITFWGAPADPAHDAERGQVCSGQPGNEACGSGGHPSSLAPAPFLTLPSDCTAGPLTTTLHAASWLHPDDWFDTSFVSHLPPAYPSPPDQWGPQQGVTDCDRLSFQPSLEAAPTTRRADAASGFNVKLTFPQPANPDGLGTPPLRRADVTLPEGMTISPSGAGGLRGCTDAQLGLGNGNEIACPEASKVGTVQAVTPLLDDPLSGGIYIRSQASDDPESGDMFRIALVLEDQARGVLVKLPGNVHANKETGRLETIFDNNPQLPVSEISVAFKDGPRAPLATPPTCGDKTTDATLTSWGGQTANVSSTFTIDCPGIQGFAPSFDAGTENPIAGTASPFLLRINRDDRQQYIDGLDMELPPGLLARLAGVPQCGDAQANAGTCGEASRVGTATVGSGPGTNPFFLTGGAYLTGPYNGGPFGLAVVVPAVAGPFDLGTVVVRQSIRVDANDAHVTVVSDPLPVVLKGVPVRLRSINVDVDRSGFMFNPTSCSAKRVIATLHSTSGGTAPESSPFAVTNCAALGFEPKLALQLSGSSSRSKKKGAGSKRRGRARASAATRRGQHPALHAVLTQAAGEANIGRVSVALPHSVFLAQSHIRTVCTRVQFAAGQCPSGSVYGQARAISPLLNAPLEGPVYLRSSSHKLPDLVAALKGENGLEIDLVGRVDSVDGGIRTTFEGVPDAPVSRFVLDMPAGAKSLLENSTNLCTTPDDEAWVEMDGQNGARYDRGAKLNPDCGKARKKKRHRRA